MTDRHMMKRHLTTACRYSFTRFSLNFYTYFEILCELEATPEFLSEYNKTLSELITAFLEGRAELDKINELRNQVIKSMEIITSYADFFQTYEYVLNRLERRYLAVNESLPGINEITEELMKFLEASDSSVVFNTRIRLILEQLPIRYTKQKFFSMVKDSLSIYMGSERSSLEDMMYILNTESLIENPEDLRTGYEDLYEILEQFRKVDFRSLTNEEYHSLMSKLQFCSHKLLDLSSDYLLLEDLINDLYVISLSREAAVIDASEEQLYTSIIEHVLNRFMNGDTSIADDEITNQLELLEGRQEHLYERYLGFKLPEKPSEDTKVLFWIDRLLSGSTFMKLDEDKRDNTLVDREYYEQTTNKYFLQAEEFFKTCQKPVVRAIMAKVLSNLPVFFQSVDEIREYITNSLTSCTDVFERESSIELLKELMESENALV